VALLTTVHRLGVDAVGHCLVEADHDLRVLVNRDLAHRLKSLDDHANLLRDVQRHVVPVQSLQKVGKFFSDLLALSA